MHSGESEQLLRTIAKIDKLKSVIRASDTLDGSKKENSAEHSWQCTMMAILFRQYLEDPVDLEKVLTMLVIHDTGEIDAGDVSRYATYDAANQFGQELEAVSRLFGDSHPELIEVWREFEKGQTVEAKYARAIDRIAGMLSSHFNEKSCWGESGMTPEKILSKNLAIKTGLPAVWPLMEKMVRDADTQGRIGQSDDAPPLVR